MKWRAVICSSLALRCSYPGKCQCCFTHFVVYNTTTAPLQKLFHFNPPPPQDSTVFSLSKEPLLLDNGFRTQHQKCLVIKPRSPPHSMKKAQVLVLTIGSNSKTELVWTSSADWFGHLLTWKLKYYVVRNLFSPTKLSICGLWWLLSLIKRSGSFQAEDQTWKKRTCCNTGLTARIQRNALKSPKWILLGHLSMWTGLNTSHTLQIS